MAERISGRQVGASLALVGAAAVLMFGTDLRLLRAARSDRPAAPPLFSAPASPAPVASAPDAFARIANGMTQRDVERLMGGQGQLAASPVVQGVAARIYRWQGKSGENYFVVFVGDKVVLTRQASG